MIKKQIVPLTLIITLFFTFVACASRTVPSPATTPVIITTAPESSEKKAWEKTWETWYSTAKKEGKIVVIGSGEPWPRQAVGEAFKKKYGITVEDMTARTGLLQQKVLTEYRGGVYAIDLIMSGTSSSIDLRDAGLYEPLDNVPILPEVIDPKVWWKGEIDYPYPDHTLIALMATVSIPLGVNTNLVKPGEEPKTWRDLLNPKWKGKILLSDPRVGGNAQSLFTLLAYYIPELGLDFWRELVKQEPVMENDARIETEWLARGKVYITIAPSTTTMSEFIKAGAPVKWVVPQGPQAISTASATVSLLKKAPHPNAAKMYINFLLSKEAQYIYSVQSGYQSGREDVPTDHLESIKVRKPGVKYIESYHGEFLAKKDEANRAAREIFK